MKVFGIAGWSGSGKTTLIRALLPVLSAQGLVVGTIKHTHHDPAFGEQSAMGQSAMGQSAMEPGAIETMIASIDRFSLVHEHQGQPEPPLSSLLSALAGLDLVLVEGFKFSRHPRLEIWDGALQKPRLSHNDSSIRAIVSDDFDAEINGIGIARFHRHEVTAIAAFVLSNCIPASELGA